MLFIFRTRGYGCIGRPAFPAPSDFEVQGFMHDSDATCAARWRIRVTREARATLTIVASSGPSVASMMSPDCRKRLLSRCLVSNGRFVPEVASCQSWKCHRNLLRARMGSDWCHLFEIPAQQAANSIQEFQIESGTRIIGLLVPITFRSSWKRVLRWEHELRKVGTR